MSRQTAVGGGALVVAGFLVAVLGATQQSFGVMVAGVGLILPGAFILYRYYVSHASEG